MFTVNVDLLTQAKNVLSLHRRLFWIVGGAGSGKSTICQALAEAYGLPVYDMDAHIYGAYHGRFTPERHPVNSQWAAAPNGLAWLLAMSWQQFDAFNQAAVPEYLDLLAEDLANMELDTGILIDGGIANPGLIAQVLPANQIVCLARPGRSSAEIWSENEERLGMKEFVYQLANPEQAWQKFLEFDAQISQTIIQECLANNIPICTRTEAETVAELTERVACTLGIA
ncbi:MAG: hypothetical protein CL608_05215 [Anaerolineaceae bacterium]|nr:hypothetical protein [Anaerolineaceae bacterium]